MHEFVFGLTPYLRVWPVEVFIEGSDIYTKSTGQ